jgi:hypothetical protein
MAELFKTVSKRIDDQIESTIVFVLRKFFELDDDYKYDDDDKKTKIFITTENAIPSADSMMPAIICGQTSFSVNFNFAMGGNFLKPYFDQGTYGTYNGNIIGFPVPFTTILTFLGDNEQEIEMLSAALINYWVSVLRTVFERLGFDFQQIFSTQAQLKEGYPQRKFARALNVQGSINNWTLKLTDPNAEVIETFVLQLEEKVIAELTIK